jgi:hypothetical protein
VATISSFTTLKNAIADWLDRDDLGDASDQFIQFAEERIYRGGTNILTQQRVSPVRIRAMETALSVSITSGVAAVPSDYLELKHAYISSAPVQRLERKSPEWIYTKFPQRSADSKPLYIAREGSNFMFGPYPDSDTYTLTGIYYAKLTALSASNETNTFTTNAPDLLLYGALCESSAYVGQDDRMQLWESRYEAAREAIQEQDEQEAFGNYMGLAVTTA